MKLLDTNVFMYAAGRPHTYKTACSRLLQEADDRPEDFNVDTELLQEILYTYTARGERRWSLSFCDRILTTWSDPIPIARQEIVIARALMGTYSSLMPRDAIHAAVVLTNQLEGIVSADRIFDSIDGIERFDPLALYPE